MAYCTKADILDQLDEDVLVQLTDDEDFGIVVDSVVNKAIADADAEIEGYCSKYDLPFLPVPVLIRKFSVDVSIYNLFARRKGAPEDRKERYDNAVSFLTKVSKGTASLSADTPAPDSDGGPAATTSLSDRVFTLGRLSDNSSGTLDNY